MERREHRQLHAPQPTLFRSRLCTDRDCLDIGRGCVVADESGDIGGHVSVLHDDGQPEVVLSRCNGRQSAGGGLRGQPSHRLTGVRGHVDGHAQGGEAVADERDDALLRTLAGAVDRTVIPRTAVHRSQHGGTRRLIGARGGPGGRNEGGVAHLTGGRTRGAGDHHWAGDVVLDDNEERYTDKDEGNEWQGAAEGVGGEDQDRRAGVGDGRGRGGRQESDGGGGQEVRSRHSQRHVWRALNGVVATPQSTARH